jgi:cyclohexyl-isocyanide hydratase
MEINRRALLQGSTGAALLAPYLALEQAIAADPHVNSMQKVMGQGLSGQEEIAMMLYPKFTALDLVGPHYFFACLAGARVHLVTTEKDLAPVASDLGLAIQPTVTMADAPKNLDVLFVPGGTEGTLSVMRRIDTIDWIKDRAARATHITSVCAGSMILAKAGLLKGRKATSHWAVRDDLKQFGAIPVDQRVVKDGNILTGAGVSAGIDFAIALVEQLRGRNYAEALVLQAEYAPQPTIGGGTLASTSKPVAAMMQQMFEPVAAKFRALAP